MQRLPLVLSATALAVVVLGSTPAGHAVGSKIPAFAKSAGYAKQAGNASALNGIRASKQPRPGLLVPLGADGRFPASVGAVGAPGPKGDKGDTGSRGAAGPKSDPGPQGTRGPIGPSGISGLEYVTSPGTDVPNGLRKSATVLCTKGKRTLGGGVSTSSGLAHVRQSAPLDNGAGWVGTTANTTAQYDDRMYVWAICASVAA